MPIDIDRIPMISIPTDLWAVGGTKHSRRPAFLRLTAASALLHAAHDGQRRDLRTTRGSYNMKNGNSGVEITSMRVYLKLCRQGNMKRVRRLKMHLLLACACSLGVVAGCGGGGSSTATPTETRVSAPTVGAIASSVSADSGTALSIAAVTSGEPTPALQWQRSNDGGATWIDVVGANTAVLTLPAVSAADQSTRFRLKATNTAGQTISNSTTLTVTASVRVLAGAAGGSNLVDDIGSNARFMTPVSLIADGTGFTVVDSESKLRSVSKAGVVKTFTSVRSNTAQTWKTLIALDKDQNYVVVTTDAQRRMGWVETQLVAVSRVDRATGQSTVLLSPTPNAAGGSLTDGPTAIAMDGDGHLWLSADRLYRLDATGRLEMMPTTDVESATRFRGAGAGGMTFDRNGNLYFTDTADHVVRRRSPNGEVRVFAGTVGQPGSADGARTSASFYQPTSLAFDASGRLLVLDQANATVRSVGTDGQVKTIAGIPGQRGVVDGALGTGRFSNPQALAVNAQGQVAVTDDASVRLIDNDGALRTLAGAPAQLGNIDGPGDLARFRGAVDIAASAAGELFVADKGNSAVRRIDTLGVVSTATTAIQTPTAVAVGPLRSLLVADYPYIRRVNADGTAVAVIDTRVEASRIDSFGNLTADATGDIYVADTQALRIRKVSGDGKTVTTLAGLLNVKGSRDGGPSEATFEKANAVALDSGGNAYVADGSTVRKITSAGVVSTHAGVAGQAQVADGPKATARFANARRIAVDEQNNVLVIDGSQSLRRITPDGTVSTVHKGRDLRAFAVLAPGRVVVIDEESVVLVSFL